MYLFGSYSQNQQTQNSDIDVALVVDIIQWNYFNYHALIWKLGGDLDSRIEPVVFEEDQPDHSGFFETIKKTGFEIN